MQIRKFRVKVLILTILFSCAGISVFGQACPTFEIIGPEGVLTAGESYTLRVDAKGSKGIDGLKYDWATSLGQIVKGQGTSTVNLSTSNELSGQAFTVSVTVSGMSSGCDNKAEIAYEFIRIIQCISPFDEFETSSNNALKARFDNLFIMLDELPSTYALIEMEFNGKETFRQHFRKVDQILKTVRFRKYDLNRLYFLIRPVGASTRTSMWIMPLDEIFKISNERGVVVRGDSIKAQLPTLLKTN